MIFKEDNIFKNVNSIGVWIKIKITFFIDTIPKKGKTNGLRRKFIFMRWRKMYKAYTPKGVKICVCRMAMMKSKIWRL